MTPASTPGNRLAPLQAGASYFAAIFVLGFALGTARTVALDYAPDLGRLAAVLIESPIMLAASWWVCARLVRGFRISLAWTGRAIMGGVAFVFLMLAEIGVDMALAGTTLAEHFTLYRESSHAAGLAAQIVFAAIPLLQGRRPAPVRGAGAGRDRCSSAWPMLGLPQE